MHGTGQSPPISSSPDSQKSVRRTTANGDLRRESANVTNEHPEKDVATASEIASLGEEIRKEAQKNHKVLEDKMDRGFQTLKNLIESNIGHSDRESKNIKHLEAEIVQKVA